MPPPELSKSFPFGQAVPVFPEMGPLSGNLILLTVQMQVRALSEG